MPPEQIKTLARECGFELAGVAAAVPVPEAAYYRQWVADGFAGEMRYLTDRRAGLRDDPRSLLPSARSILCVGKLYNGPQPYSTEFAGEDLAWISRYAWGEDYHQVLRRGLARVVDGLRAASPEPFEWKICVDTAPLLERAYARHAGLGWIGQEHLPDQPGDGLLVLPGRAAALARTRAGPAAARSLRHLHALHRCLPHRRPSCPLACARSGWALDSRLCISYFTIELRGAVPEPLRARHRTPRLRLRYLPGCVPLEPARAGHARSRHSRPRTSRLRWRSWRRFPKTEFREIFRASPISRARYTGFLRNVAMAMGNARQEFRAPLEKLAASRIPPSPSPPAGPWPNTPPVRLGGTVGGPMVIPGSNLASRIVRAPAAEICCPLARKRRKIFSIAGKAGYSRSANREPTKTGVRNAANAPSDVFRVNRPDISSLKEPRHCQKHYGHFECEPKRCEDFEHPVFSPVLTVVHGRTDPPSVHLQEHSALPMPPARPECTTS